MWQFRQSANEPSRDSSWWAAACGGVMVGAGLMYWFDPERGARRRHLALDKATRAYHKAGDAMCKSSRYTWNRARGMAHQAKNGLTAWMPVRVEDGQLCARVRSALGRAVSHPRAIHVEAHDGTITLYGDVLADEHDSMTRALWAVRGVKRIADQLFVHDEPGNHPMLQGGRTRGGIGREHWSPPARIFSMLAGAGMCAWAMMRKCDPAGMVAGTVGVLLGARGMSNLPTRRLTGIGAGSHAVEVRKTINIRAPIDRVFEFFSEYDNFPRFMRNVREVRDLGNGRSHWVVAGPAGMSVSWDAELTSYVDDHCIAWESDHDAAVENAGEIRFTENNDGSTRVDIRLCYNPVAGALGHLVAKLFAADPKSEMDGDLARAKTYLETGHAAHDAAKADHRRGMNGGSRRGSGGMSTANDRAI